MSDIYNLGPVNKQVNHPIIHGDLVIYGEQKVKRYLTALPSLEDTIIGREKDLQKLQETLNTSQRVVLMNGMGGIGKTTTAIAYANQYKHQYTHLAWVEQLEDIITAFSSHSLLVKNLGIELSKDPIADTQLILNRLSNLGGKSLLIIDNATEQLKAFKDYLPKAPIGMY